MYKQIKHGSFDVVEAIRFLAGVLEEVAPYPEPLTVVDVVPAAEEGLHVLFSERLVKVLIAAGLETPRAVQVATDDQLRRLDGIGPITLSDIREALPHESEG